MSVQNDPTGPLREGIAWSLDWNLLRSFYVVMQERSFTEAAQKLDLKQPTISNALRRLEETLGRRLIERGPRTFEPTAHGEALYRQVAQIFGSIDRLSAFMEEEAGVVCGRVALSMATHVTSPVVDRALADFQKRHPQASVAISVASSRTVVDAVVSRRAAFGICLIRERAPDLSYTHLFREHFGFFCGPTHRLFGATGLTLEDLKGERSVSFDTDQVNDVLRPVAFLRERAALEAHPAGVSNNLEEVRRMTIAGLGIAPLPIHVVDRDVRDGVLWRLPPYDDPPAIDIYVVENPATQLNRAEQEFRKILFDHIEKAPLPERTYGLAPAQPALRAAQARRR
ncbi:MAG: LysR family transcriptional regulator [Pseudomonadota bacterium]|nr:LysR family transcriptional regulator [Pseudomonadota bacterium]